MRTKPSATRGQRGFSIVELLVAVALGSILMTGAITLFVNNRDTARMTTDVARVQETARFAMDMILSDARMAGYFGCLDNVESVTSHLTVASDGLLWDITHPVEALDSADDRWRPSEFGSAVALTGNANGDGDAGLVLPNTDAVTFRYLSGTYADTNADDIPDAEISAATTTSITANSLDGADDGRAGTPVDKLVAVHIAGVSDCGGADVFVVDSTVGDTTINMYTGGPTTGFDRTYAADNRPMVAPLIARRYYIGRNARGNPALYRQEIDYDASTANNYSVANRELLEGVENMQILYGLDRDDNGTPEVYEQAGTADLDQDEEWLDVVAIKVALLVRSSGQHGAGEAEADIRNRPYDLLDQTGLTYNDLFRRRAFNSTALMRNLQ